MRRATRASRTPLLLCLVPGLLCAAVWATGKWSHPNVASGDVPLTPSRSLQIRVWTRPSVRVVDHHVYHAIPPQPFNSAGVEIRYHAGTTSTRLAAIPLPFWPLALLSTGASLGLLALPWWGRRVALRARPWVFRGQS